MEELIVLLLENLLGIGVVAFVVFVIQFANKKFSLEQRDIIEMIVRDGILYVQQVYEHLDGSQKYDKAVEAIQQMLAERNINVSEDSIRFLVESTLKKLKAEFGEQWKSEPKEEIQE